jgi:putative FmdB family regulatory protein
VPIYEFECQSCGRRFEELVAPDARPPCPECGAPDPRRLLSQIFPTARMNQSPGDAQRRTARRLGERERRREEKVRERERKQRDSGS